MRSLLVVAVMPLVACSSEDLLRLEQAPSSEGILELSHTVKVSLQRGAAVLEVKRQLRNDTPDYLEVRHPITLPAGAVATSLKLGEDGRWQRATLLGAGDLDELWESLISPGAAPPSTIGKLAWANGGVELQLFGVAPRAIVTVEYELQLSPDYEAGSWKLAYPARDDAADWLLARPELDLSLVPGAQLRPDAEGERLELILPRGRLDGVDAKWASVSAGRDQQVWRLELDVAPVLEEAPRRPNVVFVIDASISEDVDGIAAQLELVAGYLARAPDAQVEIVLYRRVAERLFGRFVPAAEVSALLQTIPAAKLQPGNGSNLEAGAALAAEALAQTTGVGRLVLFTDEQVRDGFSDAQMIDALKRAPPQTVAHVVSRSEGAGLPMSVDRDDVSRFAAIAATRGGMFVRADGFVGGDAALEQLVRPTRIDAFQIVAVGLEEDLFYVPSMLVEGSGLHLTALAKEAPSQITLQGKIWGREFRQEVATDPDLLRRLPRVALASDVDGLTSEGEAAIARSSDAVSPYTSLFAAPPDVAPSTAGRPSSGIGLHLHGYGGTNCFGGSRGCSGVRVFSRTIDLTPALAKLLAPGAAACERAHGPATATIQLEAQSKEILAVEVSGADAALASCLTEAAWDVRLSPEFSSHHTYSVKLTP